MGRILGVSIALVAVLTVIWFCSGNGVPSLHREPAAAFPQTPTEPEATQTLAPVEGQGQYTFLVAKRIGQYEADGEMNGVAALELWNTGNRDIKYAEVLVEQQERQLRFAVTYLPAGCGMIVPEKNNAPYTKAAITDFQCLSVKTFEQVGGAISVVESSRYSLQVTNLTGQTIDCVRIFYKPYNAAEALLQGGVTYCVIVPNLGPGEVRELTPYCYIADETKVVAVLTE